jgi:Glycosyl transferase family 2
MSAVAGAAHDGRKSRKTLAVAPKPPTTNGTSRRGRPAMSQFPAMYKGELTYGSDAGNMSTTATLMVEPSLGRDTPDVEIVVPVYNEQQDLAVSIARLHTYLCRNFPLSWLITVADNASTDSTWAIACRLARELDGVRALHLAQKGRGRALRTAWSGSKATVVAYMDVDLSTDLDALLPLVAPLITGHSDVAIGSRLAPGARVVRGAKREFISRTYNFILRATLHNSFSDAQCGFKAMRAEVARQLLPQVEDNAWFFDTELLVLAERRGMRVHEVAVDWVDDPGSTVDVVRTARDDLKGIARLMRRTALGQPALGQPALDRPALGQPALDQLALDRPGYGQLALDRAETGDGPHGRPTGRRPVPNASGELVHFAGVSALSTVSFAVLFAVLFGTLGGVGADIVALGLCAVGHIFAGRRSNSGAGNGFSRGLGRPASTEAWPAYAGRVLWALVPLVTTLAVLGALSAAGVGNLPVDIVALTAAVLGSAVVRFHFLRRSLESVG